MLTLPQIVRRVNERRHQSAKYVRIIQVKKGWDSLGRGYVAAASYSTKIWDNYKRKFVLNKVRNRYVTVIVFLDTRLHVVVSCSCPDFKYRWEVALNHKQAAEIEYSNGELPVIRNPSMKAAECKHLVALYNKIKDELPKPKGVRVTPISPPEIQIPPSQRKPIEPVKVVPTIKVPKNVQRSTKPGKKQSTLPPSMRNPPAMKAPPKAAPTPKPGLKAPTPPAFMKPTKVRAPTNVQRSTKPGRKQSTVPQSMRNPPAMKAQPKQATKPAAANPPAMRAKPKTQPQPSRGPAMMRTKK